MTVAKRATAHGEQAPGRATGLLRLARPRPAAGRQAPPGAPARTQGVDARAKLRYQRAVEAWPNARDRAIALLPLYAGLRIAEVSALDVADMSLSARKGQLHIVGQREKSRTVLIPAILREALTPR